MMQIKNVLGRFTNAPDIVSDAEDAWRRGDGDLAAVLVLLHKRSQAAYIKRFPQARAGWTRLVNDGHMSVPRFAQAFEPTRAELERWLDDGVVSPSECVQLLENRPVLLRELAGSRNLDMGILCTRAPRYRKYELARELLQANMPVPRVVMTQEPRLHAVMWDLFARGSVEFETAFATAPRPPAEQTQALLRSKKLSDAQAHALGALDTATLGQRVADGTWNARDVVAQGPVPDSLVNQWIATGKVDQATYMAGSLSRWCPEDPLPVAHVRVACRAPSPEALVTTMTLPKDKTTRIAYAQRMVVAHMQGIDPYTNVNRGNADACSVCFDAFDDDARKAFKLSACDHEASICVPCARTLVATADTPTCHVDKCGKKTTPNDVTRLDVDPGALTRKLIASRPAMVAEWFACPTTDCVGARPNDEARNRAPCRVCDVSSVYPGFDPKRDLAQVQRLIRGLFSDANAPADAHVIRECYHCGTATERDGGCPAMNCTHCHKPWNFFSGPATTHAEQHGPQTYVPHAGLLLRIGLFGDLTPGRTAVKGLPERVTAEAKKLRIPLEMEAPREATRRGRRRLAITAAPENA